MSNAPITINRIVSSYTNEKIDFDKDTQKELNDLLYNDTVTKDFFSKIKNDYILNGNVSPITLDTVVGNSYKTYRAEFDDINTNDETLKNLKKELISRYIKHTYLSELLFRNNFKIVAGKATNSIFIFPILTSGVSNSINKMNTSVSKYYKWISEFNENNDNEYFHLGTKEGSDPPYTTVIKSGKKEGMTTNSFVFVKVFNEETEESDTVFETRLNDTFNKITSKIIDESKNNIIGTTKTPYTNIYYMVDDSGNFFTNYYGLRLKGSKLKILNETVNKFINGSVFDLQPIRLTEIVKNPIELLNENYVIDDIKKFCKQIDYKSDTIIPKLKTLISKINIEYKSSTDKNFASLVSESTSIFKLYYRVNNIDTYIDPNVINTGSDYLYKLEGVYFDVSGVDTSNNECNKTYICKFMKLDETNRTVKIEVHNYETLRYRKDKDKKCNITETQINDAEDIEQDKEPNAEDGVKSKSRFFQTVIEFRQLGGVYIFKQKSEKNPLEYNGTFSFYKYLHSKEKYKWFKHSDINGSLSNTTDIRYREDILFDEKSLVAFLKSTKSKENKVYNTTGLVYEEKNPNLGYIFLKINSDLKMLKNYTDFILSEFKDNVNRPSDFDILLKRLPFSSGSFMEKIKKSIMDLIFQPNQIIYIGGAKKSTNEKKDTRDNYKVIGYTLYNTDVTAGKNITIASPNDKTVIKTALPINYFHFNNISVGEEEEDNYCPHRKIEQCEILTNKPNVDEERLIAIVDITRDVYDASLLKSKANCKKLKKSIKARFNKITDSTSLKKLLLGQIIGGNLGGNLGVKTKKKKRRTTRKRLI